MVRFFLLWLCSMTSGLIVQGAIQSDTAFIQQSLCHNDSLFVHNQWFDVGHNSDIITIENGAFDGSDSIIVVNLDIQTPSIGFYRDTFCASQTILLFGKLFSPAQPSGEAVLPGASINGCDSLLLVQLTFGAPGSSNINDVICPDDTLFINGTPYHQGFFIGTELIANGTASGCDSLIEIHLEPRINQEGFFSELLYEDESRTLYGEVFDINQSEGRVILPNMAENGCDSILNVQLAFKSRIEKFAYVPSIFQPTATEAINQTLQPGLSVEVTEIHEMRILDRWGSLVFYDKNKKEMLWDGRIRGKNASMGTYFVYLVLTLEDGRRVHQEDTVTLLR